VNFETDEQCRESLESLQNITFKDFKLNPSFSIGQRKPVRVTPPLFGNCEARDLNFATELIKIFD